MNREEVKRVCTHLFSLAKGAAQYQEYILAQWKKEIATYKTIILYGAGFDAHLMVNFLEDILPNKEVFFVDKNPNLHGHEIYKGIRCYGIEKAFRQNPDEAIILVATTWYANEILGELDGKPAYGAGAGGKKSPYRAGDKLGEIGINARFIKLLFNCRDAKWGLSPKVSHEKDMLRVVDLLDDDLSLTIFAHWLPYYFDHFYDGNGPVPSLRAVATYPQYFPEEIRSRLGADEVFLDCGAFIGDTVEEFYKQTKGRFQAIYSFEMDESYCQQFMNNPLAHDKRVRLIKAGVSDQNRSVKYVPSYIPSYSTEVSLEATTESMLRSIDSLVQDGTIKERVSFVKMDIEGAEMDALRGMRQLMQRDRPKLAICVYHKPEDLWEIPLYIHSIVSDYKFILRHHSRATNETVLYAYLES